MAPRSFLPLMFAGLVFLGMCVTPSIEASAAGLRADPASTPPVASPSPTKEPECPAKSCETLPDGAMYGNPPYCSEYYKCVNGQPTKMTCPSGQHFLSSRSACVHAGFFAAECFAHCKGKNPGCFKLGCSGRSCCCAKNYVSTFCETST